MPDTPNYLTYEQWPPWARNIYSLMRKADATDEPRRVSPAMQPLVDEVEAAILEDRVPRSAATVLADAGEVEVSQK